MAVAAAAVWLGSGSPGRADTLLTTSGTTLVGDVERTASGAYVVKSPGKRVEVPADQVRRVIFDTRPAAAATAPAAKVRPTPAVVLALLARGQAALTDGQFADARTAFAAAAKADPANPLAPRGVGLAAVRLNDFAGAIGPLESAVSRTRGNPDRHLVLALSAAYVATKQPMRAAHLAGEYFRGHAKEPELLADEPLLDALGNALSRIKPPVSDGPAFADATRSYDRAEQSLEPAHPGLKKWGLTWTAAGTVDGYRGQIAAARLAVETANETFNAAVAHYKRTYALAHGDASQLPVLITDQERKQIAQQAADSLPGLAEAKKSAYTGVVQAKAALAAAPRPEYPDPVATDDLDLTVLPTAAPAKPPREPE